MSDYESSLDSPNENVLFLSCDLAADSIVVDLGMKTW